MKAVTEATGAWLITLMVVSVLLGALLFWLSGIAVRGLDTLLVILAGAVCAGAIWLFFRAWAVWPASGTTLFWTGLLVGVLMFVWYLTILGEGVIPKRLRVGNATRRRNRVWK